MSHFPPERRAALVMSALGHKATSEGALTRSALSPTADIVRSAVQIATLSLLDFRKTASSATVHGSRG